MTSGSDERTRSDRNFVVRYWRGGFSLGVSYWAFGLLTNAAALFLGLAIGAALSSGLYFEPLRIFALMLILWGGIGVLQAWQLVGLWRSATRHAARRRSIGRTTFWAGAAKVMAVLGLAQTVGVVTKNAVPQMQESYRIAFMGDPDLPDYSLRVMRKGTELEILGGIKYGLRQDFERVLASSPEVRTVHLTSVGGRLGVADEIADIIKKAGLSTYVPVECASACTLIFAAGSERWLLSGARLGFHGPAFPGMGAAEMASARRKWADALKLDGIEPNFVNRSVAILPDDMWYPTEDELVESKVVTRIADSNTFALSGYGSDPLILTINLLGSGISDALADVHPDAFKEISAAVERSYVEGQTLSQAVSAVRNLLIPIVDANLPKADDDVLIDFASVLVDEYAALRNTDPQFCYQYAMLGTGYDHIPTEVSVREVALNERVLRTGRDRPPIDSARLDQLWESIGAEMRSVLTVKQMDAYSSGSTAGPAQYDDYCAGAIAMFHIIAGLPKDDASMVMRQLFATK